MPLLFRFPHFSYLCLSGAWEGTAGAQAPRNVPLLRGDYFVPEAIKALQVQEKLLPLPNYLE